MRGIINIISDFLLGEKDILTTSIDDVFPYSIKIEDFPPNPASKEIISRFKKEGVIKLKPGVYDFYFKSFCLHAGKYAPYKGSGYLIASLKGRGSRIIKNILKNSLKYEGISQEDVQSLIWAVLANGKYASFSPAIKEIADKLLEKEDLSVLGKSFLNFIPSPIKNWIWEEIEKRLPQDIISIRDKLNRLKEVIQNAQATYQELEGIAIKLGKPPISENMLDVSEGTWSQISNDYFIRIFPDDYTRTRMQVYVRDNTPTKRKDNYDVDISATTACGFNPCDLVGVPANTNMQRLGFGDLFDSRESGGENKTLTHEEALELLKKNGRISLNSSDKNITSLEGIRINTIEGIINLQTKCGFDIVITGGTERGHTEGGIYSHINGYKIDVRDDSVLTAYIKENYTYFGRRSNGDEIYKDDKKNEYCHETKSHHWDITYY